MSVKTGDPGAAVAQINLAGFGIGPGLAPVALGWVGPLHTEFKTYRETAERMCQRFDARFPLRQLLSIMKRTYKLIASRGNEIVFDDRLQADTPATPARN
ncbi:MAG: hypothetical protein K9N23_01130 [Akkermansiaceae bacterium]|nr:hypothetical protein [Akkermansiaceae bacterium]